MVQQKKLIHEVSGWLRVYDDGSVDRTWTGPPELKFMAEPVPPHEEFIAGVAVLDVTIDQNSGHRVRIYLPEVEEHEEYNKLPILLHFHGGGFCISQADWYIYYHIYTRFAREARVICVSPFLSRAPERRLPAAIDDGYSALLWLQSLAKAELHEPCLKKHADFRRVFLIGDSSGGNIVHHVAARAGKVDLTPLKLTGMIPIHPGFLRSERSKSELENPETPFLTRDMADKFINLSLPIGATKDHPLTCPMGPAAEQLNELKIPPYLLCLAEKDLIWDTEMEFYEAMKKANKDIELFISKGMTHSFYLNKIEVDMDPNTAAETGALIAGIKQFIDKY
ncbi:Alpha/beta-Hydrolases superfamily protein [Quillaja saponaria]|uniref:Alpha/beta-Hydrolases superfamily protein n=1 Tax=Quillaja saponaria TaxID=32244 RepID=A0AAD7L0M3_QUISA|nr:Alpha/beta-Hydrolases superfamily protein [Quillaja saponaria]